MSPCLQSYSLTPGVHPPCRCEARSSVDEELDCDVEKEARLASVARIEWPDSQAMEDICAQSSGGHSGTVCYNVPVAEVLQFVNATSPHDACAAVVKLL